MSEGTKTLYDGFAVAAPGANLPIIGDGGIDIGDHQGVNAVAVTVALNALSIFNITVTRGATTKKFGLNSSVALAAGDLFGPFLIPVTSGDAIDFEVETNVGIDRLIVEGLYTGVR